MENWETQKWKGENTWHENKTTRNIVWRQIPHETPPFMNRSREFLHKSKWTLIHQFLNALLANTFPFTSVCLKEWTVVFHHIHQNMNPNTNSCTTSSFCFPSIMMKLWEAESCSPQLASVAVPPALHEASAVLIIQQTSGLKALCNLAKLCNCSPKILCSNNQNSPFDCKKGEQKAFNVLIGHRNPRSLKQGEVLWGFLVTMLHSQSHQDEPSMTWGPVSPARLRPTHTFQAIPFPRWNNTTCSSLTASIPASLHQSIHTNHHKLWG